MLKKEKKKIIRTILEIVICIGIIAFITNFFLNTKKYTEPDKSSWKQRDGFVALSYTGVAKDDTDGLISKDKLDTHLKALYDEGYVTIGSQDIVDFYNNKKPLPDKALFILFEDGSIDTMVYATPILEKYNYKGTLMTYASSVEGNNRKLIGKKHIKQLEKNSYWEIGCNGYRFSYINVVLKDDKYLYTHYLMDYLRDINGIPKETTEEMKNRITWDYEKMNEIYNNYIGYTPQVYSIMHSNKVYNNMNLAVEEVNLENIYNYFDILFNRNDGCYNSLNDSIYNLTVTKVHEDWNTKKLIRTINESIQ